MRLYLRPNIYVFDYLHKILASELKAMPDLWRRQVILDDWNSSMQLSKRFLFQ